MLVLRVLPSALRLPTVLPRTNKYGSSTASNNQTGNTDTKQPGGSGGGDTPTAGGSTAASPIQPLRLAYWALQKSEPPPDPPTPVILLGGVLSCKETWESVARTIYGKTGRMVVAVDGRSHGDSPRSAAMSPTHQAEDVYNLATELGLSKVNLVGHGSGGMAAMLLALTRPAFVERLVVVESSPLPLPSASFHQRRALNILRDAARMPSRLHYHRATSHLRAVLNKTRLSREAVEGLMWNIGTTRDGRWRWRTSMLALERNQSTLWDFPEAVSGSYGEPVLFVVGDTTGTLLPGHHDDVRKMFPRATFLYMVSADHWPHIEHQTTFADVACSFLNKK